jgi:Tol biopolymer transport system component
LGAELWQRTQGLSFVRSMRSAPAQGNRRSRRRTSLNAAVAWPRVAAIGLLLIGCSGPGTVAIPKGTASPSTHEGTATLPPEGKLLLYTNDGPVILSHAGNQPTPLQLPGETIWAYDLSPDGSEVLALPFQREPTGITREPKILVIDAATGERSVVVRVGPKGDLGPASWSPEGARIAYRLTVYPVDPAETHPGPRGDRDSQLCILEVPTEQTTCYPNIRRVSGFAWAPDGRSLVVDVVGFKPLFRLDVATARRSVLVPPDGAWTERAGVDGPVNFGIPGWSPSGAYLSVWVNDRPVIFHADGRLVMVGRRSRGFSEAFGWSPTEDVFAYARGKSPYRITETRLLDPVAREVRRITSAERRRYPFINELAWSPSGQWLAVLRWRNDFKQRIDVIDVTGNRPPIRTERADSPVLIDWGP